MNESTSFENNKKNQPNENSAFKILGIIFFILGILISLLQLLVAESGSSNQLYYIFGGIVLALVLILIANFAFKKKKGLALMILSIVFLILSIILTSNAFVKKIEENRLNNLAIDKFVGLSRDYASGKDLSTEKYKESDYGKLTPLLNLTEGYFISYKKLNNDLSTQLTTVNFQTILAADTYSSQAKTEDAQKKLRAVTASFDQFDANSSKIISNMQSDLTKLDIPTNYKNGIVAGFNKAQVTTTEKLKSYIQVEKSTVKKMDDLMSFMLSQKGTYEVKDKKVYFTSSDTLTKYNSFISDLQKLADQEASITNEMKASMNKNIDDINKYNKK